MNKSIYCGNISSHVLGLPATRPFIGVTQSTIVFTGFDLSASNTAENKLDLLFYNRVNEIGEVLSSLVYISNPLELDDVSDKLYDVKKLYANTDAEKTMGITSSKTDFTYLNRKWATSKFFTSSISPLSDTEYVELTTNGIPSVKMERYGIAFDGWYTQMSVGFRSISVGTPPVGVVRKGLVGYHTFADLGPQVAILTENAPANIDADSNWSIYTYFLEDGTINPDGTVLVPGTSLASLFTTLSSDNPYIKQDLFILPTYLELYNQAAIQYAEYPTYANPFPVLRDKHRIIHDYASDKSFHEAQYIVQTTDYFRAVIQL